jgi:hypothetical protein
MIGVVKTIGYDNTLNNFPISLIRGAYDKDIIFGAWICTTRLSVFV